MFTFFRAAPSLSASARLRRLITALAAVTGGVAAWAATVPAASAATIPVPGPGGAYGPVTAGGTVQVITAGGMPGWQITLIALAAALAAATAAVFLDRARDGRRRSASVMG